MIRYRSPYPRDFSRLPAWVRKPRSGLLSFHGAYYFTVPQSRALRIRIAANKVRAGVPVYDAFEIVTFTHPFPFPTHRRSPHGYRSR